MQIHNNLFNIFIIPFNRASIRYMVTGSVASIMYGEPRMTHDIDLVVMLTHDDISELPTLFSQESFYLPPEEVIKIEAARTSRGHFNIIHNETGYKADVYIMGNDPVQIWGFKNRQKLKLNEEDIWLAPPEYVIVKKLSYWEEGGHEKHIHDIEAMLEIQGDNISEKDVLENLPSEALRNKFTELLGMKL